MQNKYVSDAADYGKLGLLRWLCGETDPETQEPDMRLGVVWYMHPDQHGPDGRHIGYLTPSYKNIQKYGICDPELWDGMRRLNCDHTRCVKCLQGTNLLPPDTQYHPPLLYFIPRLPLKVKQAIRAHWIKEALNATKDADLVWFDPDNGLADEAKMYRMEGPKHAYISDLQAFWTPLRKQSLIVYQEQGRVDADVAVESVTGLIRDGLDGAEPIVLRCNMGMSRLFVVIPQPDHREQIEARIGRMLGGPWQKHFERMG